MSTVADTSRAEAVAPLRGPALLDAGRPASGEYTCAECGYGVSVRSMLPVCPMCRGLTWEPTASSQYGFVPF
jgi:rubrerythrin